jgi:hypothetical protein
LRKKLALNVYLWYKFKVGTWLDSPTLFSGVSGSSDLGLDSSVQEFVGLLDRPEADGKCPDTRLPEPGTHASRVGSPRFERTNLEELDV